MADLTLDTQDGQVGSITTSLGKDALLLEGFAATERLSEPFSIVCEVLAPGPTEFGEELGTGASVEITGDVYFARAFHGVLTEASEIDRYGTYVRYSLVLRPWLWLLQLGKNSRIFQQKTARDIIKQVFDEAGVSNTAYQFNLNERGTIAREYCVQYDESDFNFVSRLMEEEGIYYFFAHTATSHTMTLCDGPSSHSAFDPGDVPVNYNARDRGIGGALWHWSAHVRPALTKSTLRDVHFKTSDNTNETSQSDVSGNTNITAEIFEYPGGFSYLTDDGTTTGADLALVRLQAARADRTRYAGDGDISALTVGCLMTTAPIDSDDEAMDVLVTGTLHRLSGQTYEGASAGQSSQVSMSVEAVPSTVTWRPERRAEKPMARGPQVATVVGSSGKEIEIDEWGRVHVQFPWDREDQKNQLSSCWVRVSSGWAGPSLGEYMNPRIGQEVLVSYIEGDMDRPVITGRVFDSKNVYTPPKPEVTYSSDRSTISGWITQTVGGKSTDDYDGAVRPPTEEPGYNALLFNDISGGEEVFIRAQRDMHVGVYRDGVRTVHRDESINIGRHLKTTVATGDETHTVTEGQRTTTIHTNETTTIETGDETHTVQTGKRTTSIKDDETLTVESGKLATTVKQGDETHDVKTGKRTTTIMGHDALTVSTGNYSVDVSVGTVSVSSPQQIQLKCGPSQITMTPASIEIKSPMIMIKGDSLVQINGALVTIN